MALTRTKKLGIAAVIFGILHLLCLFGPFLYFIPVALITGTVVSKVALSLTVVTSLILAAFSLLMDVKHRAGMHRGIMWLLIAGVLFCLEAIKPFIWIMAIVSILDEIIFVRLRDRYKTRAAINKEMDKRTNN